MALLVSRKAFGTSRRIELGSALARLRSTRDLKGREGVAGGVDGVTVC